MKSMRWAVISFILISFGIMVGLSVRQPRQVEAQGTFAPFQCNFSVPVSSASSVQIITAANSNMIVHVCSAWFGSIGGSDFSMVEGTGTTCGTNTKAMVGGTTAATGMGLAADGTTNDGGGVGSILETVVPGDNVCLIVSGTGPLSGVVSYSQSVN